MNLNAVTMGEGAPLILLHGWGGDHRLMMPLAKELSRDYQVWAVDLYGFGQSDKPQLNTFEDYVEALHDFLEEKEITEPIFAAHSFGARVALFYALKYPMKAMILTGAAGIRKPLSMYKKVRIFLHRHQLFLNQGSPDYQKADAYLKKLLVLAVNMNLEDRLSEVRCPVCLIWGEKDQETPLWMGKRMEKQLQNATLFVFKNEDHFAYLHQTQRFAFIVRAFLKGVL